MAEINYLLYNNKMKINNYNICNYDRNVKFFCSVTLFSCMVYYSEVSDYYSHFRPTKFLGSYLDFRQITYISHKLIII